MRKLGWLSRAAICCKKVKAGAPNHAGLGVDQKKAGRTPFLRCFPRKHSQCRKVSVACSKRERVRCSQRIHERHRKRTNSASYAAPSSA